jgi:hypothetical protein
MVMIEDSLGNMSLKFTNAIKWDSRTPVLHIGAKVGEPAMSTCRNLNGGLTAGD